MKTTPKDPRRGWTSASSAAADELCAGRYRAQQAIPSAPNAQSQYGIDIHSAFAGEEIDLAVSQERILELAEEICADAVLRVFGIEGKPRILREKRLWTTIGDKYEHSGQCDRIYFIGTHALIADLKSLRGEVQESPENMQLRDEATLTFLNYPKIKTVSVFICQPLVERVPVICKYEREAHFLKMYEAMAERIYASHDLNSKRTPGAVQCLFCRARATCAPAIKWAKTMPLQRAPSLAASVDRLSPEQLVELMEKEATVKSIFAEVKRRVGLLTDLQLQSLGWRRNEGHTRRTISNPNELYRRLAKLGVTDKEFTAIAKIPIGRVSDLVRKKTGLFSKNLDRKVSDLISDITEEKRTESSLEKL